MKDDALEVLGTLIGLALGLSCLAGWLTHVFICLAAGKWGFLLVGIFAPPIGIIHGIGIWFGAW